MELVEIVITLYLRCTTSPSEARNTSSPCSRNARRVFGLQLGLHVDQIQLTPAAFEHGQQFQPGYVVQLHGLQPLEFRDGGFHCLLSFGEGLFRGIDGAGFRYAIAAERYHGLRQFRPVFRLQGDDFSAVG